MAELADKGRVQGSFKSEKEQILHLEKLYQEKKFDELLLLMKKAIEEYPGSFHIRLLYARVLRALGRLNEAEFILKDLSLAYPGNINLLFETSFLQVEYEKYDEAVANLNKILFLDSFNTKAKELLEKINLISSGQAPPIPPREITPPPVPPETGPVTRKQAAPMFKGDTLREEDMPAIPTGVFTPPAPRMESSPVQKTVGLEDEYMTDSAAELYLAQGLLDEALAVYQHLFRQRKEEKYRNRVNYVMAKKINQRKIQVLTQFLKQIQSKGENFV